MWGHGASGNITESIMTAQAYCPSPVPGGNLKLRSMQDHLPCNSDPIGFVTFDEALNISDTQFLPFLLNHPRTSDCIQFRDEECASIYQFTKENALQDVYHSIRRDLGIHSPNQIWASPDMFNKTIRAIPGSGTSASAWGANELRANRSAGTWTPWDMEHDESVKNTEDLLLSLDLSSKVTGVSDHKRVRRDVHNAGGDLENILLHCGACDIQGG
ncbi:hypothetical protein BDZ89DRAFT_543813 [Hymenopellis radicata]|nr:hypothetical protein BDZ89DRAFT_543813 [Hymenopellis radicata]